MRAGDLIAGGLLGVLNYGAIYFLVKVLGLEGWQSSQLFPIYSVGVVTVSSLLAVILFKERLSTNKDLRTLRRIISRGLAESLTDVRSVLADCNRSF